MNGIGERFYYVRKSNQLTQAAFGEKVGISRSFVSKIENDREVPSIPVVRLVSVIFGLDERWLIDGYETR